MTFRDLELGAVYYYPMVPEGTFVKVTAQTMAPTTAFLDGDGWRLAEDPRQRVTRAGAEPRWREALAWKTVRLDRFNARGVKP